MPRPASVCEPSRVLIQIPNHETIYETHRPFDWCYLLDCLLCRVRTVCPNRPCLFESMSSPKWGDVGFGFVSGSTSTNNVKQPGVVSHWIYANNWPSQQVGLVAVKGESSPRSPTMIGTSKNPTVTERPIVSKLRQPLSCMYSIYADHDT